MFLAGGPAFSGTTLLSLLLNQEGIVCLDEPDFHKPEQSDRGLPVLRARFPDAPLPEAIGTRVPIAETFDFMMACERAISPVLFGIKTNDFEFIALAGRFREEKQPVIAIVRDIRDALVTPLPPWLTEESLNERYRRIWSSLSLVDDWIRYEDLVSDPSAVLSRLAPLLGRTLTLQAWDGGNVHWSLLKLPRHDLLRSGRISAERVGIWRTSGRTFPEETHQTARMMGYAP